MVENPGNIIHMPAPDNLRSATRQMEGQQSNNIQIEHFQALPSEDGEQWIERFEYFSKYKTLPEAKQLDLFPMFLKGNAWHWFHGLPADTKENVAELKAAFRRQYAKKQEPGIYAAQLFNTKQETGQRVADYLVTVRKLASQAKLSPDLTLQAALHGMSPTLKPFVSRNPPRDLNELLEQAEAVEEGQGPTKAPTVALTEAIASLTAQLEAAKLANVQAVATTSQRQVLFQDRSRPRHRDSSYDRHSSRERSNSNQRSYMPRDYSYDRHQFRGYENPRGQRNNQTYSNQDRNFSNRQNGGYQQQRNGFTNRGAAV